jgi:hypothetical protein
MNPPSQGYSEGLLEQAARQAICWQLCCGNDLVEALITAQKNPSTD